MLSFLQASVPRRPFSHLMPSYSSLKMLENIITLRRWPCCPLKQNCTFQLYVYSSILVLHSGVAWLFFCLSQTELSWQPFCLYIPSAWYTVASQQIYTEGRSGYTKEMHELGLGKTFRKWGYYTESNFQLGVLWLRIFSKRNKQNLCYHCTESNHKGLSSPIFYRIQNNKIPNFLKVKTKPR